METITEILLKKVNTMIVLQENREQRKEIKKLLKNKKA